MIDIKGLLMDMKILTKLGINSGEFEKLLPILVRYAVIDKNIAPVTFFKLKRAVENEVGINIDEAEWRLFKKIRYLYSLIMNLEDEELILLSKVIEVLLRREK